MKLTPLNIVLACVLVWAFSEMSFSKEQLTSWIWVAVLAVILVSADILFRVRIKNLRQLWMLQIGFILIVGIVTVLIKTQF